MARYPDVETLIAAWLHDRIDVKTWADPELPAGWNYTAPVIHVQRGPGEGDPALTLDAALLDVDVYAALPDNARRVAELVRREMRLNLPLHTFDDGPFVKGVTCTSAPSWLPGDVPRRGATYRAVMHGLIAD